MLTMRGLSMGGHLNQKKLLYGAILVLVAIALIIFWQNKHHTTRKSPPANSFGLSNAALISSDTQNAQSAIYAKNYQAAISNYTEAVNTAVADNNLDQAEALLKDAINKIPDSNVPWVIYDDLVGVAKAKGDKSLEISSLKKAIIKAQQPNSGAPPDIVSTYNKMLSQLGAS